jgi:hypothetical protein
LCGPENWCRVQAVAAQIAAEQKAKAAEVCD